MALTLCLRPSIPGPRAAVSDFGGEVAAGDERHDGVDLLHGLGKTNRVLLDILLAARGRMGIRDRACSAAFELGDSRGQPLQFGYESLLLGRVVSG